MTSNYDELVLKTTHEHARELYKELRNTNFSFFSSPTNALLVEKKDVENVQEWFLAKGIDSIHGQRLCVIKDTDETFGIHPSWFDMDSREALIYQYIANKYDFKSMDIDMRNFQSEVRGLIYKEEQAFCKDNGIYDNYVWDLYTSPFLNGGSDRLFASLRVKILNEQGYRRIDFNSASKNDFCPWFGVYVRKEPLKEFNKPNREKDSLANLVQSAEQRVAGSNIRAKNDFSDNRVR